MVRMRTRALPIRGTRGGAKGIRTPDLLDANETRYQLRHSPKVLSKVTTERMPHGNVPHPSHGRANQRHHRGGRHPKCRSPRPKFGDVSLQPGHRVGRFGDHRTTPAP